MWLYCGVKIEVPRKLWYPVTSIDECQPFWKLQLMAVFSVAGNVTYDSAQQFTSYFPCQQYLCALKIYPNEFSYVCLVYVCMVWFTSCQHRTGLLLPVKNHLGNAGCFLVILSLFVNLFPLGISKLKTFIPGFFFVKQFHVEKVLLYSDVL